VTFDAQRFAMRIGPDKASLSSLVHGPPSSVRSSGFTLVELVIALALIGLITLLLFSGLRVGARAWEGVETLAERSAEPRIARNFLARALIQTRPMQVTFEAEQVTVFRGDAENLEFVAPLSEHVGTPGLYILRLSLVQGELNRLVLTRWLLQPDVLDGSGEIPEWKPFDGGASPTESGPLDEDRAAGAFGSTLLLDGVKELEIGYFGIAQGQQEPEWYSEWLDEPRMPLAVRIHLTTKAQTWPDILIRLPAS
jgi:general secretion pathway protein J